ncbi:MAG: argininosuccinate synthase [Calditrichota bacterium]
MDTSLTITTDEFIIQVATPEHVAYAEDISHLIEESAKVRGTGIAKRTPEYITKKMNEGKAIIATHKEGHLAGFCYIETWTHGKYIANSGLIVAPEFRNRHLGKLVKQVAFNLSRKKFPKSKLFGITTSHAVMKINTELGYKPVPYSELTTDDEFWEGCKTCVNFNILQSNKRKNCLCTALLMDPKVKKPAATVIKESPVVVLAFSGGLDTSYCVKYLSQERHLNVHSVIVDTGGFSDSELEKIEAKAKHLGVTKHVVLDQAQEFYQKCIKYLTYGNVLKNNTYPLSVSSERIFQAFAVAGYAKEIGAKYIAHGSTGAGNDQVRFDMIFNILLPEVEIITPVRDNKVSRNEEIEYLKNFGIMEDWSKAVYSINKGIWGTSVGGRETLTSCEYLPEEAFPTQLNIGRDMHVGDTIIGIKGRVGFEAGGPLVIIKAHHALEKHVLTKWQLYWKDQLANWYGNLLHEGHFLDPVMRDIEKFLESTQKSVTGTVSVLLAPYRFQVLGITSPYDLMSPEFATYGEMNNYWDGDDVRGFSKIFSTQSMIHYKVNLKNAKD